MEDNREKITPLRKLLINTDVSDILNFLEEMKVSYSLSRREKGDYHMTITKKGMVKYQSSGSSKMNVICGCVASFLVGEQVDYHEL